MAKDTITLALNGEVTIRHFASAISNLETLVQALSDELGVADKVEWVIHDLQVGSATATIRGETEILEQAERVVDAYASVGKSLQAGKRPDFTDRVVKAASAITGILDDRVSSVRFETADLDVTISRHADVTSPVAIVKSFGAIEGRVQTLSNRKGLRFNLYDTLHDRAVSCYVKEGQEDQLREVWGKRAIVEGEISRERLSGRPVAIRQVSAIRALSEVERGSYLEARGVSPLKAGAPMPEETIRRLRDA
ncbi:MAG: hypothetical protein HY671_14515 [Chloroflexi bacterium]|nr:hypothetical protein [Chloroflexota bacterium]